MIKISPSLLSGDFARLGEDVKNIGDCGADYLHLDVMDGLFVPNISFGAPVIKAVRPYSTLPFDVHLMINEPIRYIDSFCDAGADIITVHTEACSDIGQTLAKIKARGCIPSMTVKPRTPVEDIFPYLNELGMVLIMSVEPGFSGQAFMPDMLSKVKKVKAEIERRGLDIDIEIDGGISEKTIAAASAAGANVFVTGSAVFGAENRTEYIASLRELASNCGK